MQIDFVKDGTAIPFIVELSALEGVKRISHKIAEDVQRVSECKPELIYYEHGSRPKQFILFATLGESNLVDDLVERRKFSTENLVGKREVFKIQIIEEPFENVNQMLIVCGSDKRGTIYGMFAISEYIGVSPLCFWGDVTPLKKSRITISEDIVRVSKEPSVKYRGFFINDEWPCFGNWTFSHYGGFTAHMYEHVFELLLRLKGNYLWPAMWSSSFPLDGPGSLNEELADIYGVVIGFSHHEPCLRASEEWDKVRGEESPYGNEWNFYKNEKGLLKYWEDGLKRSGKYEHIITIGMRGERDSSMLGEESSLEDNIGLLKDIITKQRELIKEIVDEDLLKVPQLLALYKEVEDYFYGDATTPGLKDWDGLEGVTLMLCEDNFGYLRTLPTKEIRNRNAGFGMYYHFDYHGGPISYEWLTSTPLTKVWEQMTMAYDYGVKDVWIVNVGDLKFNEIPLAYFLTLAYDFEAWGSTAPNSTALFTEELLRKIFPDILAETRDKMAGVLKDYIDINGLRRPESLHAGIYHPCHYLETDRMLAFAEFMEYRNEEIYQNLNDIQKEAFYSLIYYPAKASINLLRMHLYAGKNAFYASQGKTIANTYSDKVTECIHLDKQLAEDFSHFKEGKWDGMHLAQHIGFVSWNEDNYRYPVRMQVEPAHKPRMIVSRKDDDKIAVKNYGSPMTIEVKDFLYASKIVNTGNINVIHNVNDPDYLLEPEVILEIANDGIGELEYSIEVIEMSGWACDWLTVTPMKGIVKDQIEVRLVCNQSLLPKELQKVRLLIKESETTVAVHVYGKAVNTKNLEPMTFLEYCGVITMDAHHFCKKHDTEKGVFKHLREYGKSGNAMKVFPTTATFGEHEDKPSLTYRFLIEESGEYIIEVRTAPTNPVVKNQGIHYTITTKDEKQQIVVHVANDFRAGDHGDGRWCYGVLNQVRASYNKVHFGTGMEEITIGAMEAGFVLERILIYPKDKAIKPSYLGPMESFYKE